MRMLQRLEKVLTCCWAFVWPSITSDVGKRVVTGIACHAPGYLPGQRQKVRHPKKTRDTTHSPSMESLNIERPVPLPMRRHCMQIKVRLGRPYATSRGRGAKSCNVPNSKF